MKIAFIGGGVMGETIISRLLGEGLATPKDIIASDISHPRRQVLSEKYGIKTTADNRSALEGGEVVVLAIKPQSLAEVMNDLAGHLRPGQLLLSIVAGASIATISKGIKHSAVVRVMPNILAQIGEGMSVWTATADVTQSQREAARSILAALGKEIYVTDERYLDMVTAVSGSGPAYVFLVIESLLDGAVHIGLPHEMARQLVIQTMLGATRFVQETGKHPAELRNMVTSPGGTTAKGLLALEEGGIRAILAHAIIAAYGKAKELGG